MDIVWLGDRRAHDRSLVGGKAATLSRLSGVCRIPPGFCVTAMALDQLRTNHHHSEEALLALPTSLAGSVAAAYQQVGERCGEASPWVAVRSSALDEDGSLASFAGQHASYLNVAGVEDVAAAIVRCWASAWTLRALAYRRRHGLPTADPLLAVLVQHFVAADVSIVVFSAHPLTGSRHQVVVTASWGLGESIVGGTVTPDAYVVCKTDLAVVARQIGDKARMTVPAAPGVREVDVPALLRGRPALTDEQVREIAWLAVLMEQTLGWPVDLECAYREGSLFLLQCRPITAMAPVVAEKSGVEHYGIPLANRSRGHEGGEARGAGGGVRDAT